MKILGIETSCDETGAAVITIDENNSLAILSNVVASSMALHAETGGIIPEIAAREQSKYIIPVLEQALQTAQLSPQNIDALAVTIGPGLIGSLLVGVETVKTLSLLWNKPIIPVNHLYGHIYANWLMADNVSPLEEDEPYAISNKPYADIVFPALALIVSGGHTDLVLMKSHKDIRVIAGTRDDAAGEAFDKIGRLLGLPYPAGPIIEELAKEGNPKRFQFPRPLIDEPTFDFSFSGLKTAVLREVQKLMQGMTKQQYSAKIIDEQTIKDLARGTQDAIIDVLVTKTLKAAKQHTVRSILIGGGVAANNTLSETFRKMLDTKSNLVGTKLFFPTKSLCTDNAAMIAAAAYFNQEIVSWENISANPELYFDE